MKTLDVLDKVLKGKRVSDETRRHYRVALNSLAKYSEDFPKSGEVVDEWVATLDNYADITVRIMWQFVNSAGAYVEKISGKYANGLPRVPNPCREATKPKVAKKRRRYFTASELVRIIQACRYEQDKVLIVLLIDSTARVGELVGLRSQNVGDGWIDVKGKTGERRYRCDKAICVELRRLGADGQPIFKSRLGGEADVRSLKNRVRRVIIEAGITGDKLGPHTLRHSGASLVAQETGSALAVKALLQHDNIATSMEYIHDVEDEIQQRISPLRLIGEKVFGSESGFSVEAKQLGMGDGEAEVIPAEETNEALALFADMFPEIKEGTKVRPLLKEEDLKLLRRVFLAFSCDKQSGSDIGKARDLLCRMLRKTR